MSDDLFPEDSPIQRISENKAHKKPRGTRSKLTPYLGRMQCYTARVGAISDHYFNGKPRTFVMLRHLKRGDSYIDNHIWVLKTAPLAAVKIGDWIRFNAVAGPYVRGLGRVLRKGDGEVSSDIGLFSVRRVEIMKRNE